MVGHLRLQSSHTLIELLGPSLGLGVSSLLPTRAFFGLQDLVAQSLLALDGLPGLALESIHLSLQAPRLPRLLQGGIVQPLGSLRRLSFRSQLCGRQPQLRLQRVEGAVPADARHPREVDRLASGTGGRSSGQAPVQQLRQGLGPGVVRAGIALLREPGAPLLGRGLELLLGEPGVVLLQGAAALLERDLEILPILVLNTGIADRPRPPLLLQPAPEVLQRPREDVVARGQGVASEARQGLASSGAAEQVLRLRLQLLHEPGTCRVLHLLPSAAHIEHRIAV
mmetsp:Transcript_9636/g.26878  ORF Transcript_9636/g.26878 Transcript_9636/m.26878 type:complete len:282 (+) Transcript_9636:263-1108(+)